jgi:hypothetical protein
MHLAPTNIRLLVSAFLFFLALPVATEASLMRNWDWVDDPATFKPRRHLRMCVCPAEDFAIGESTLNSLTIEAATNIDSRCTGGTNPGVPCTAATNDCLGGGTCAADQGAWTVVPFGIPNCPALGTCDPVCDVIVRKEDHNRGGGAYSFGVASLAEKDRVECSESRYDPTPLDNRGRCVTAGACVGGKRCESNSQCQVGNCNVMVGAACVPGKPDECPAGRKCRQFFCSGGANNTQPCRVKGAVGDFWCPNLPMNNGTCQEPATTWGVAGNTLDPRSVEMHEFSHKFRINHEPVGGMGTRVAFNSESGNLIDPVPPGNHQLKLSTTDTGEFDTSDQAPLLAFFQGPIGPAGGNVHLCATDIADTCVTVDIPAGALAESTVVTIRPFMTPTGRALRSVPEPYFRIMSGVEIESGITALSLPATITIEYDHLRVEDVGYGLIDEMTLAAFEYDPILDQWNTISSFSLDPSGNTLSFSTSDLSPTAFAIGGEAPSLAFLQIPALGGLAMWAVAGLFALSALVLLRKRSMRA